MTRYCSRRIAFSILALTLTSGAVTGRAGEGPAPFPDKANEAAWPGKGPIRVFKWMTDNRNFFWTKREKEQGAIVLVGDSLTGGLKQPLVDEVLPGMKVANRGIGGDVSRGVLFRFREDVLDLNPKAVVICIGTNDLSAHADPEIIAQNIGLIIDQAREFNAALPVVVCTIPPRDNPKSRLKKPTVLADLNTRIKEFGARENVVVVDLFSVFATPDGAPDPAFFREDFLHLNEEGSKKWLATLRPVLEKVK